jgi:hypothetical protein
MGIYNKEFHDFQDFNGLLMILMGIYIKMGTINPIYLSLIYHKSWNIIVYIPTIYIYIPNIYPHLYLDNRLPLYIPMMFINIYHHFLIRNINMI